MLFKVSSKYTANIHTNAHTHTDIYADRICVFGHKLSKYAVVPMSCKVGVEVGYFVLCVWVCNHGGWRETRNKLLNSVLYLYIILLLLL